MNDPATCKHGNFNFNTTMNRIREQGNFVVTMNLKCTECGCDFYFYGVKATGPATPSCVSTSENKRALQIFVGPEPESWEIPDGQLRQ
jgi:hypothetical protein